MDAVQFNSEYNDELDLVESLYEFHPKYFDQLSDTQRKVLSQYYLFDKTTPEDIFFHRSRILSRQPELEQLAKEALNSLKKIANIQDQSRSE